MSDAICTERDDFVADAWLAAARWEATLASGATVYQDDDRPGRSPASAWLRLARHAGRTGDRVVGLRLAFRGEPPVVLPEFADGYFFRNGLGAFLDSDITFGFFLTGVLHEGRVMVQRWKVPEMALAGEEASFDAESVGESLIR